MNGKHEVLSITIKPEAVDPDDIEMLEDWWLLPSMQPSSRWMRLPRLKWVN